MKRSLRNVHTTVWILLAIGLPLLIAFGALCKQEWIPQIFIDYSSTRSGNILDMGQCDGLDIAIRGTPGNATAEVRAYEIPTTPAPYLYRIVHVGDMPDTVALGPLSQSGVSHFALTALPAGKWQLLVADALRDTVLCTIQIDL